MIRVYLADTQVLDQEADFSAYLELVDASRREKVLQHRRAEDRKRSLLSGLLLQIGIREWLEERGHVQNGAGQSSLISQNDAERFSLASQNDAGRSSLISQNRESSSSGSWGKEALEPLPLCFGEGTHGKPYLKAYPDLHFSLSHSGRIAVCALAGQEVGVDIQQFGRIRDGLAERFFSPEDQQLIREWEEYGVRREEMFFRIWTIKEAYMKLTGEGMSQGLHSTRILPGFEMGRKCMLSWKSLSDSVADRGVFSTERGFPDAGAGKNVFSIGGRFPAGGAGKNIFSTKERVPDVSGGQNIFSSGEIRKKSGDENKGYFKTFRLKENYDLTICSYEKNVDIDIRETLVSEYFRREQL